MEEKSPLISVESFIGVFDPIAILIIKIQYVIFYACFSFVIPVCSL